MIGVQVGDNCSMLVVDDLTRMQIVQYVGVLGDYNLLHIDDKFIIEVVGYLLVFVYGMFMMGMIGRVLIDWFGVEGLVFYGVRFVKQVFFGDMLIVIAIVMVVRDEGGQWFVDFEVFMVNQDGDVVLIGMVMVCFV